MREVYGRVGISWSLIVEFVGGPGSIMVKPNDTDGVRAVSHGPVELCEWADEYCLDMSVQLGGKCQLYVQTEEWMAARCNNGLK